MTESILTYLALEIEYKAGLDKEGKDVFRKQSITGIKEDASDAAIAELGNVIGRLLNTQIYRISKNTKHELITF